MFCNHFSFSSSLVTYWRTGASHYSGQQLYSVVGKVPYLISGFHREVDGTAALLGYYAASSGNFLPTFWYNLSVSSGFRNPKGDYFGFFNPEDGTERLDRNVSKKLPLFVA
jgi:hypothetical protein